MLNSCFNCFVTIKCGPIFPLAVQACVRTFQGLQAERQSSCVLYFAISFNNIVKVYCQSLTLNLIVLHECDAAAARYPTREGYGRAERRIVVLCHDNV